MEGQEFIHWARKEIDRISTEAMQKRHRMEALINQMSLELGEANGQMRMLERLIEHAEKDQYPWRDVNEGQRTVSYPTTGVVDSD